MAVGRDSNKITFEINVKNPENQTLTDEDRQLLNEFKTGADNLIKKGTSKEVLLADGTSVPREDLAGNGIIFNDDFEI